MDQMLRHVGNHCSRLKEVELLNCCVRSDSLIRLGKLSSIYHNADYQLNAGIYMKYVIWKLFILDWMPHLKGEIYSECRFRVTALPKYFFGKKSA